MKGRFVWTRGTGSTRRPRTLGARSRRKGLGHQVTLVVDVSAATVEFDSRIAAADLEVKELGIMLAGKGLG